MLSSLGVVLAIPKVARRSARWIGLSLAAAVAVAGCGSAAASAGPGQIAAVGAENEYADVISQIGGRYVTAARDREQPQHRPAHLRGQPERRAQRSPPPQLVVQNGLGYDGFMDKIESASPSSAAARDRRAEAARPAGLDPEPAPLVQPDDDAGGRGGDRPRPRPRSQPCPRRLLPGQRRRASTASLQPWLRGAEGVRRAPPARAGRDHRAGRRLHAEPRRAPES